MPIFPSSC